MSYTSQLVPSIVAKAILSLKANQAENGGVIDYERFNDEVFGILEEVKDLEQERDDCLYAIRELVAEKRNAEEQRDAVQSMFNTHYISASKIDFTETSNF